MIHSFASITSVNRKYLPAFNALVNGLGMYGNFVDLHVIVTPDVPESYINRLPNWVFVHPFSEYAKELSSVAHDLTRGLPWQVRFLRYIQAARCCDQYDAVQILDSDCFVVDSIMLPFCSVSDDGVPQLVCNPLHEQYMFPGMTLADVTKACEPPYHCHGAYFNAKHKSLLEAVFALGLVLPFGDMVCLHRVLIDHPKVFKSIRPLRNELWCMTEFWEHTVVNEVDYRPRLSVVKGGVYSSVAIVHGRWFDDASREKALLDPMCTDKYCATHNTLIFNNTYSWFNKNGVTILLPEEREA